MSRRIKMQISILKSSISTLSCWINLKKKVFLKNKMKQRASLLVLQKTDFKIVFPNVLLMRIYQPEL